MNILLMLAHAVEEYDQTRLLSELGYDVFSIGSYLDPSHPHDPIRPPLSDAPHHPELAAIVEALPVRAGQHGTTWAAKDDLPDAILEWADTIIVHHVEGRWLWPHFGRFKAAGKRVIWRTVGQSNHVNEWAAQPYVREGCEVVRYSPRERAIPNYAGESALIRFWKDPTEYAGWHGSEPHVLVITQNPIVRAQWVGTAWAQKATEGLPVRWVGPQTEQMPGGLGKVSPEALIAEMQQARVVLWTGTIPASYTLGLIETMMTGCPVLSIGPTAWSAGVETMPYIDRLLEGHRIAPLYADMPKDAHEMLGELLTDAGLAERVSAVSRQRAIMLFGRDRIAAQWRAWLDDRVAPEPDWLDERRPDSAVDDWPDVALFAPA